jgi:beta-lactamase regulating signal transducer with metallopeptidase domain
MSDLVAILLRVNLALAAGVAAALVLRLPVRRLFGARIAYGLWLLAPLAVAAMLVPARVVTRAAPAEAGAAAPAQIVFAGPAPATASAHDLSPSMLAAVWAAGALASLALLAWRQAQFARTAREGTAGPAVIGVLRPRIVTPDDFALRYTAREQAAVLAHEAAHIARHDSRINALVALARCALWCNPAVHVLAHYLRIDQELACDARVVAAHPTARRPYAEAMLKTQLAARPLPLGCYWPAAAAHPLAQRVRLLARPAPGPARQGLGAASVILVGLGIAGGAWLARPAEVVWLPQLRSLAAPDVAAAPTRPADARPAAQARPRATILTPVSEPLVAAVEPATPVAAAPDLSPPSLHWTANRAGRIASLARRSSIEPGSAVRVVATLAGPDGAAYWQDLTSFGSQSAYRKGAFGWDRDRVLTTDVQRGQRHGLFTAVEQHGDQLWVTASLDRAFDPASSATLQLKSGETGHVTLPGGQVATITPTLRPETPEELADGQRELDRLAARAAAPGRWDREGRPIDR